MNSRRGGQNLLIYLCVYHDGGLSEDSKLHFALCPSLEPTEKQMPESDTRSAVILIVDGTLRRVWLGLQLAFHCSAHWRNKPLWPHQSPLLTGWSMTHILPDSPIRGLGSGKPEVGTAEREVLTEARKPGSQGRTFPQQVSVCNSSWRGRLLAGFSSSEPQFSPL